MYSWKTVLVTIGLLFGLKIWNPYLIENITWSWFDFLHQQHEIEKVEEIVLVDIDEKSLEKYGFNSLEVHQRKNNELIIKQKIKKLWISNKWIAKRFS